VHPPIFLITLATDSDMGTPATFVGGNNYIAGSGGIRLEIRLDFVAVADIWYYFILRDSRLFKLFNKVLGVKNSFCDN
jgi:hypothetical protein